MLKNYIKITFRNLWRSKLYTTINLFGLAIGISSALVIMLYVQDEMSYDQYFEKSEDTYRVLMRIIAQDNDLNISITPGPLAPYLEKNFPEIETGLRIFDGSRYLVRHKDTKLYAETVIYVDEIYFDIFDHNFLYGSSEKALSTPNSVVITEDLAERVFGRSELAMGKTLTFGDNEQNIVRGVVKKLPKNSSFRSDAYISFSTLPQDRPSIGGWASFDNNLTFVYIPQETNLAALEEKITKLAREKLFPDDDEEEVYFKLSLQPLADIHLKSSQLMFEGNGKSMQQMYILLAIGIFILLIASINYVNMSTARSSYRAKETGIRKVLGSYTIQIIQQYLFESITLVGLAVILGLSLSEIGIQFINQITQKDLSFLTEIQKPNFLLLLLGLWLGLGFFSGLYPAFVLSSFRPITVLKGRFSLKSSQGIFLRKGLVVFQFTISIVMIIGTWVAYQQAQFMKNKELGFDKEQLLRTAAQDDTVMEKLPVLKQELLKNPMVQKVSITSNPLGRNSASRTTFFYNETNVSSETIVVDPDYFSTISAKIIQGRNFDKSLDKVEDSIPSIIVNETFVKRMNMENPVGLKIEGGGNRYYRIVGVVKNFHFMSLHTEIVPAVFGVKLEGLKGRYMLVRLKSQQVDQNLVEMQKAYEKIDQKYPFEYEFVDDAFLDKYAEDERLNKIFFAFAGLAIFVACLGLFGLASFTTEQRTKEVGIRKVLGASAFHILKLLSIDVIILVGLASMISFIAAYFLIQQWLQNFAYQMPISWGIFVGSGFIALTIALLTISYHALKTAFVNPVDILRNE